MSNLFEEVNSKETFSEANDRGIEVCMSYFTFLKEFRFSAIKLVVVYHNHQVNRLAEVGIQKSLIESKGPKEGK